MKRTYTLVRQADGTQVWQEQRPRVRVWHTTDHRGVCLAGCPACAEGQPPLRAAAPPAVEEER